MSEWVSVDEYASITNMKRADVESLIVRGSLTTMIEDGEVVIEITSGINQVLPATIDNLNISDKAHDSQFVEKTIGTIINLHEKVLDAKDETIESIKNENMFLKEALSSLQELYDEDRKTIDTLTEQLRLSQQEVEFMRRKYKLMWGKVIDEHNK